MRIILYEFFLGGIKISVSRSDSTENYATVYRKIQFPLNPLNCKMFLKKAVGRGAPSVNSQLQLRHRKTLQFHGFLHCFNEIDQVHTVRPAEAFEIPQTRHRFPKFGQGPVIGRRVADREITQKQPGSICHT